MTKRLTRILCTALAATTVLAGCSESAAVVVTPVPSRWRASS